MSPLPWIVSLALSSPRRLLSHPVRWGWPVFEPKGFRPSDWFELLTRALTEARTAFFFRVSGGGSFLSQKVFGLLIGLSS